MIIRLAVTSDSAEIARLTNELGYFADPSAITNRLTSLTDQPNQLVLVAVSEEKIVGWLQAHASVALESGYRVEIVGLIVSADSRRCGVGRRLVERAEQWAQEIGAETVVVRSNTKRTESHHFFPALGYSVSKTQTVYRKLLKKAPKPGSVG